jgi:RimJ/RimL family protein N-acetyltransferase
MIYGERIRLRAIERTDLAQFTEWLNDPEVRQGLMINLPFSLAKEETWYENMLKSPQEEHPLGIEIMTDEGWELIGNCGLFDIDWKVRQAEFGIFIGAKPYWNQGYGTEALRLIIRHGFNTLNLNRIFLRVYENNPRAIRSYEKAGLTVEGRKRQAHYDEGQFFDVILMCILRSEWEENK